MGGVFTTFFPDYAINVPEVDAICIGEGYGALLDLCTSIERGRYFEIKNIKNLWVKELNGTIHKNKMRPPVHLNNLPFDDYNIFDEKRLYRPMHGKMLKMVPVWIDIGCPYQCKYCIYICLINLM